MEEAAAGDYPGWNQWRPGAVHWVPVEARGHRPETPREERRKEEAPREEAARWEEARLTPGRPKNQKHQEKQGEGSAVGAFAWWVPNKRS